MNDVRLRGVAVEVECGPLPVRSENEVPDGTGTGRVGRGHDVFLEDPTIPDVHLQQAGACWPEPLTEAEPEVSLSAPAPRAAALEPRNPCNLSIRQRDQDRDGILWTGALHSWQRTSDRNAIRCHGPSVWRKEDRTVVIQLQIRDEGWRRVIARESVQPEFFRTGRPRRHNDALSVREPTRTEADDEPVRRNDPRLAGACRQRGELLVARGPHECPAAIERQIEGGPFPEHLVEAAIWLSQNGNLSALRLRARPARRRARPVTSPSGLDRHQELAIGREGPQECQSCPRENRARSFLEVEIERVESND